MLYPCIFGLCSLADNLHDVVSFALMLEIVPNELEGVPESGNGRESHIRALFLLPSALYNSCEDGVGVVSQSLPQLSIVCIANVTDCGERGLLLAIGTLSDILDEMYIDISPATGWLRINPKYGCRSRLTGLSCMSYGKDSDNLEHGAIATLVP